MRSNIVRTMMKERGNQAADRASGMPHSVIRQASHRSADTQIINIHRLPVTGATVQMQNADGTFLTLAGYDT